MEVALRHAVGVGRDRAGVAADAHCRAHRVLRRRRAVGLVGVLAEGGVALLDQIGVDRGRARIAAECEGAAGRILMRRSIVILTDGLADVQIALADLIGVERQRVGRTEDTAILLGRDDIIQANAERAGIDLNRPGIEFINARTSKRREALYRLSLCPACSGKATSTRDAQRLINTDRNHFAASMVALGDADAMVTGTTRNYSDPLEEVRRVHLCQARPHRHRCVARTLPAARRCWWPTRPCTTCRHQSSLPTSPRRPPVSPDASATIHGVAMLAYLDLRPPRGGAL